MPDPTWIDSKWVFPPGPGGEDAQPEPVQQLGDFELLREIGRGGMGIVYEARQVSLKRRVALKVLPPTFAIAPQAIQRFQREAHAAAKLHHTNIVPVYAIGQERGHHFYVMELVEGQSLAGLMGHLAGAASKTLETSQEAPAVTSSSGTTGGREWFDSVGRMIAEVAEALHYAHGRGVIHRDIKPANLLLAQDGRLLVTDFGLARLTEESSLTLSGSFMGTPAYMSPEQIASGRMKLDHRTDVYSLGAVLYELLTHSRPHPGESREEIVAGIMTRDPRRPRRINHRIPLDLETICLKALEKDPDRRYPTAADMAKDLRLYLNRGLIAARRAGPWRRTAKAIRQHPVAATIVFALLAIAAVASGFAWRMSLWKTHEAGRLAASHAKELMRAGLYREGLGEVDRALVLDPGSAETRVLRAHVLLKLGRAREATLEAEAVLHESPDDWTAHLVLAAAARELPWINAGEHIEAIRARAPESADAYYMRSLIAESSADKRELLNQALRLDPGHVEALLDRIKLLTDEIKDYPAALRDCTVLAAVRPRSSEGQRLKALVYADQRNHLQALSEIQLAIDLDPSDALNFKVQGLIYEESGRHAEAIADFDRAIELDPRRAVFFQERAEAFNAAGEFEPGLADARRAIELDPDTRSAHLPLFQALLSLDRKDDLRRVLDDLAHAADGWADQQARAWAYREIANQLRLLKDYEKAMAIASQAIEVDPEEFRGFIYRARIRHELKDGVAVAADCRAAANAKVKEPKDLGLRGEELTETCGLWEQALEDHDRFVAQFPGWYRPYFYRATSYYHLRRYHEAIADLTRAITLAPNWAGAYVNRAVNYNMLDRLDEQLADLDKAIELDPYDGPHLYMERGATNLWLGQADRALADLNRAIELDPLYAISYVERANARSFRGDCATAAEDLRKAEELAPTDPSVQRELALAHTSRLFYDCPAQYDGNAALRFARSAFEDRPHEARDELGYALYRNGRYEEARRILLDSHREGAADGVWFFLAMASWKLGVREEARRYYDESIAWMKKHDRSFPMVTALKDEAARMLGVLP